MNTCLSKVEYLGVSSFPERNTRFLFSVSTGKVLEKYFEILIFRSRNKSKLNSLEDTLDKRKLGNYHKSSC